MDMDQADISPLYARHSCRAFLKQMPPIEDIHRILRAARRAPSGANLQPGHFHVLANAPLHRFCNDLATHTENEPEPPEYTYFPHPMPPDYKARQRAAGYALYQALGIDRRDLAGRRDQFARNYRFFDAPIGIVVTLPRSMGAGCFMDLGMSIMALMIEAQAMGYGTCGIGALANYGRAVHGILDLPPDEIVVCGIALGRPDPSAPVNGFRTDRAELDEYTRFYGFAMDGGNDKS